MKSEGKNIVKNKEIQTKGTHKRLMVVTVLITVLLLLVVLMSVISSFRVSGANYSGVTDANVQKLENRRASIEKEINGLKNQINSTKSNKNAALENKKSLDQQIKLTQDKIEVTEQLIETLTANISVKEIEIAEKEAAYEKKLENFKQRLRINHEEGDITYLEMLLSADGLADFFIQKERIDSMMAYDKSIMETIVSDKEKLESEKADFEQALEKQRTLEEELLADQASLAVQAEEAAGYINKLIANESDFAKQLAAKEAQKDALDKEIADYVKQLQAQNTKYVGGEFMWPVPLKYTYVSSECVWRNSPLSGRKEFHNGIDIPVAFGTDIYASNSGTVVKSQWHNSYGYYVMIDHGGGYATLYAHNSKLLVSVGDEVVRGQVIAKAGSTGDSTGNHCHFSMYENGAIINPRKYFPA